MTDPIPPCRRCSGTNFSLRTGRHRDGRPRLIRYCVDCTRRYAEAWREEHPDEWRYIQARWSRRNRSKATEATRRWRERKRAAADATSGRKGGGMSAELRAAVYAGPVDVGQAVG